MISEDVWKMKIGIFIKDKSIEADNRLRNLLERLGKSGCELYDIENREDLQSGTEMVMSVGGDGTFLSASKRVAQSGVPIIGVNLGRLGFLSENSPENVVSAILHGEYTIESRTMLGASVIGSDYALPHDFWPYALNEVTVHRSGAAVLGIKVSIDHNVLPTYWADGLLVAKVLVIAPIAPHNLNVRPLVVPDTSLIEISIETREQTAVMTMDNRTFDIDPSCSISVSMAQFSLKRIRLAKSSFVKALTSKLFWGEDIRNNGEYGL